jgi:hypothetical protein
LLGRDHGFTGRLDAPDAFGAAALTFELPVSLPPDGRYPAIVGPAWKLGRRPEPASVATMAIVADGQVALEIADGAPPAGDVRVVLLRPSEGVETRSLQAGTSRPGN